jgi:hypothetical protein
LDISEKKVEADMEQELIQQKEAARKSDKAHQQNGVIPGS